MRAFLRQPPPSASAGWTMFWLGAAVCVVWPTILLEATPLPNPWSLGFTALTAVLIAATASSLARPTLAVAAACTSDGADSPDHGTPTLTSIPGQHSGTLDLGSLPFPAAVLDEGQVSWANQRLAELLGLDHPRRLYGSGPERLLSSPDHGRRTSWRKLLLDNGRGTTTAVVPLQTSEGTPRDCTITAMRLPGPARVLWMVDGRKKSARERLERLATIGSVTSRIAHDVNNLLSCATVNLSVIEADIAEVLAAAREGRPPSVSALEEVRELAAEASLAARNASLIAEGMQRLGRDQPVTGEVDVREVLDMAIRMVGREVGKRALVVRRYRPVPPVLADESRLGQVFLNLLMNAAQAIPTGERDDHLIRVSTDTDPSGDVVIEVSDTGTGISAPAAHQLFEPFFTTRSDGTGLGLAICREIVDELGGDIRFQSAAGRGTTFRIVLPHPPEPTQGGPH